jgi:hypothetical protein
LHRALPARNRDFRSTVDIAAVQIAPGAVLCMIAPFAAQLRPRLVSGPLMALQIVKRSERHGYTVLRILRTLGATPPEITYSVIAPDGDVSLFHTREKAESFIDASVSAVPERRLQAG